MQSREGIAYNKNDTRNNLMRTMQSMVNSIKKNEYSLPVSNKIISTIEETALNDKREGKSRGYKNGTYISHLYLLTC